MAHGRQDLWFDGTLIRLVEDRPLRHLSAGLYIPANTRGLLAAGMAAEFRLLAGPDVEQELRAHVPIPIGSAVITGVGNLADRGVQKAAHGVSVREPGTSPRRNDLERALIAALTLLEQEGIREITLPLATTALDQSTPERAQLMANLIAAQLRRRSRLKELTIAGLDAEFLDEFATAIQSLGAAQDGEAT